MPVVFYHSVLHGLGFFICRIYIYTVVLVDQVSLSLLEFVTSLLQDTEISLCVKGSIICYFYSLVFCFRALFIMLDSLQNKEPEIRCVH